MKTSTKLKKFFLQALALKKKIFGLSHHETAYSFIDMANVLEMRGHFSEAIKMCRNAYEIRGKTLGDEHPETINSFNRMVSLQKQLESDKAICKT